MSTKYCIYCDKTLPKESFSLEHIWPDALGGDYLPDIWKTKNVCRSCNSIMGIHVDAKFIKSFFVMVERSLATQQYIDPNNYKTAITIPTYLGPLRDAPTIENHIIDYYAGQCGTHILHVRPDTKDDWGGYAGGNPKHRLKAKTAGRVYIAFCSNNEFWILSNIASIKSYFPKSKIYAANASIVFNGQERFKFNRQSHQFPEDIPLLDWKERKEKNGDPSLGIKILNNVNFDHRFLAKVGLGIGCSIFGVQFSKSKSGQLLRKSMREANKDKRSKLTIRGQGFLAGQNKIGKHLKWPGAWILLLKRTDETLGLTIISPSGKDMSIQVTDDVEKHEEIKNIPNDVLWLTIPQIKRSVGPLSLIDYIQHSSYGNKISELTSIEKLMFDPNLLPPCLKAP